jgi:hypothetical protein
MLKWRTLAFDTIYAGNASGGAIIVTSLLQYCIRLGAMGKWGVRAAVLVMLVTDDVGGCIAVQSQISARWPRNCLSVYAPLAAQYLVEGN